MRVAFISYEYPPDTADGGIATYVFQAAAMLRQRGNDVEVFAGSRERSETREELGILVHRIRAGHDDVFAGEVGAAFAERHRAAPFDVLEGPDFSADAHEAVCRVPDIPLVLKLHTPSIVLLWLNYYEPTLRGRLRLLLSALRQGKRPRWGYDPAIDAHCEHVRRADARERAHAALADEIASPSLSLAGMLTREWRLDSRRVRTVPYPYVPAGALLDIPADSSTNVVTFLGRLEVRKGVLDLARAIPLVLQRHPSVRFRFVGPADDSPERGLDMMQYLRRQLRAHERSVEFAGSAPPQSVPAVLAGTDICVFPSLWENFPCVCLEAMAAARGIVGSSAGGMSEMLEQGVVGRIVQPRSPAALARTINALLDDPPERISLGQRARARLLEEYNCMRIGELQEESYARAIARRRASGPRRT